jgi:hypothetical protein
MIEIKRQRFFGRTYQVALDGTPVAEWSGRTWRTGGEVRLGGEVLRLRMAHRGRSFEMTSGGQVRASAERSGREWVVVGEGQEYRLGRPTLFSGRRRLLHGGRTIGEFRHLRPGGLTADLPGVSPTVQVFTGLLVLTLWQRQAAATAAAGGASGG